VFSRDLEQDHSVLTDFIPSKARGGNTKQLREMAKAKGIELKPTQTASIVARRMGNSDAHSLASYRLLESLVILQEQDPTGLYVVDTAEEKQGNDTKRHFKRMFVSPGCSHHFWNTQHTRPVAACDGTHAGGDLVPMVWLLLVTKDANNQLVLLARAVVDQENASIWAWFFQLASRICPHPNDLSRSSQIWIRA